MTDVPPTSSIPATASPRPTDGPSARWRWWRLTIIQVVVTWTIYVLSIGPLYWTWYAGKHVGDPNLVAIFYEPLYQLAGLIPPLGWFLNWYVALWIL